MVHLLALVFALSSFAQQNFFNVPSAVITKKDRLFIQQQVNIILKDVLTSNTTLSYGLGGGFEVGANLFNVNAPLNSCPLDESQRPIFLLNGQKVFRLNDRMDLGLGTQFGAKLTHGISHPQLSYFHYVNFAYTVPEKDIRLTLGGYQANEAFKGQGRGLIMMGIEVPIIKQKFHVIADYLSGDSDISASVIGINYFYNHKVNLSLGCQMPNDPAKPKAVVLELTLTPGLDKVKRKITL